MVKELLKHLFKKPATLQYPFERVPLQGFRGKPNWDIKKCTGCELCYKVCPSQAIEMTGKGREAEFKHHLDRCLFCGQCAEVCPVNAITMAEEYEPSYYDRARMVTEYRREN